LLFGGINILINARRRKELGVGRKELGVGRKEGRK
jgi:hypothetical protein